MDYIPKTNNYVIKPISDGTCDWIPFTTDVLKNIMNGKASDEQIEKMFPAKTFFGMVCELSSIDDIKDAIDVLKATLTIHNILLREPIILMTDPETLSVKKTFLCLEDRLEPLTDALFSELLNYPNFQLKEGNPNGSSNDLLFTLKIPLSKSYYDWLKPRVESYKAIGKITKATAYTFLNMRYNIGFCNAKANPTLKVKIYGHISLHSKWDNLADLMSECFQEQFFASEKYLALMFLADILASIHLITTNVEVRAKRMLRPTSGDLLTDFWFNCYDDSSDADLRIDNCEVCNGLFITNSKSQRGHERCMNRKRVMEARAKQYALYRSEGKTEKDAARLASINPETAKKTLESKYGKVGRKARR